MYQTIKYPDTFSLEWFPEFSKALNDGNLSIDDYKKSFQYIKEKQPQIVDILSKKTKDELLNLVGGMTAYRLKTEKKDRVIDGVAKAMLDYFTIGTISYSMGEQYSDVLERYVNSQTQESLEKYAKEVAERREERKKEIEKIKKAYENPETLQEFKIFIDKKGIAALNVEQKKLYDSLISEGVLAKREVELKQKSEIKKVEGVSTEMTMVETIHTSDKYPLFVVQLADRLDKDKYTELNQKAKQLGGWYSSFKGNGAIPGFQFKDKSQAEKFMALKEGDVSNLERKEEILEAKVEKRAVRLRDTANSIIEKADETLNQDRLTNTYKRAQQASSTDAKAMADKQLAQTMLNIADAIDSGEAKYLDNISSKTHVELLDLIIRRAKRKEINAKYASYTDQQSHQGEPATEETVEYADSEFYPKIYGSTLRDLIKKVENRDGGKLLAKRWEKKIKGLGEHDSYSVNSDEEMDEVKRMYDALYIGDKKYNRILKYLQEYGRMKSMKIENSSMLREVLREYIRYRGGKMEVDKVKTLERQLAGRKDVGFDYFPTPNSVAVRMVEMADITEGMDVLEPSAGNGNIADAIKAVSGVTPDVIEISSTLREILEAKGYNVVAHDFMDYTTKKYDRIIMNPPFSNGLDADHIKHAYELLKPGGRIVAIAGEGVFIRSDKKATEFQNFLSEKGVEAEKLDANTFMDKKLYSTTGANARLLVIDKEANDEHLFQDYHKEYLSKCSPIIVDLSVVKPYSDIKELRKNTTDFLNENYLGEFVFNKNTSKNIEFNTTSVNKLVYKGGDKKFKTLHSIGGIIGCGILVNEEVDKSGRPDIKKVLTFLTIVELDSVYYEYIWRVFEKKDGHFIYSGNIDAKKTIQL